VFEPFSFFHGVQPRHRAPAVVPRAAWAHPFYFLVFEPFSFFHGVQPRHRAYRQLIPFRCPRCLGRPPSKKIGLQPAGQLSLYLFGSLPGPPPRQAALKKDRASACRAAWAGAGASGWGRGNAWGAAEKKTLSSRGTAAPFPFRRGCCNTVPLL